MKQLQTGRRLRLTAIIAVLAMMVALVAACQPTVTTAKPVSTTPAGAAATTTAADAKTTTPAAGLSGRIVIDGSSTVFPIAEAVAEEYSTNNPQVQIPVGFAGTGGGFKKFAAGETDISNASRPIKDTEKAELDKNKIEFIEIRLAYDGISVVVNKANYWASDITVEELNKIWKLDSTVKKWKDVRAEWPDEEIKLYAPGTDSGTFDYFTEVINKKAMESRKDFTPSEDDNVLVKGIEGDKYAMGYFGFAYYVENKDQLKVLHVDNGKGAIEPTMDTIKDGTYAPLSRPVFMYVKKSSLERPEVKAFLKFYLTEGVKLIPQVGYIPLEDKEYTDGLNKLGLN